MLKNKTSFKKIFLLTFSVFSFQLSVFAQAHVSNQSHSGFVTNLAYLESGDGSVFSSGNDGL